MMKTRIKATQPSSTCPRLQPMRPTARPPVLGLSDLLISKRIDLVLDVIGDLERQIAGVRLAPERREDLTDSMKLLGRRASQKPYKVAIVGRTGVCQQQLPDPALSHVTI
ncbi:hypothetical protein B0H10DRAFT_2091605 [Mycena sp. CBHHK59/15]|nr:hypothetical protein B0H10DRAFT_2091605 [Mycena sp. CBHHK59/15]